MLRLREQEYPDTRQIEDWPTWDLPILKWAKAQGAVVGFAHSGLGLQVQSRDLPNYDLPPFNGIGACEYIVDVTHDVPGPDGKPVPAVDFLSMVDTPSVWELNIWYHTLNAGFRTRISGETDFPCIYGERVGLGRSYVKLPAKWTYEEWCEGIRAGRNYVGDGKSHLMEFTASAGPRSVVMGEDESELKLAQPGKIRATARVAGRLNVEPSPEIRSRPASAKPYWDIERARIGDSREVAVELIVNGYPVAKKNIPADGRVQDVTFDATI